MALDPGILFLDEPSAGLDPITSAGLDQTIRGLSRGLGITFVVVTHELQSIYAIADRCVMLDAASQDHHRGRRAGGPPRPFRGPLRAAVLPAAGRAGRRREHRKAGAMSAKANQFRIGIFVVAGIGILAVALFLFGIRGAFQPMYRFETYVTGDVPGLSIGSAVKLQGVAVGKVKEIGFSWRLYRDVPPRCVVVSFEIEEKISPIPPGGDVGGEVRRLVESGFRAIVQSEGITGSSIVALKTLDPKTYPPLAVPWKPRDLYIPSAPSQFGQILASLDRTLASLAALDLAKIGASADRALNSADETIRKLGQLDLPALSRDVNRVTTDASAAVREYQGLASDARQTLQALKLERVGADADRLVNNLDSQLQVLIAKLNAIDVPALNDTLAGTREAARNLNDALEVPQDASVRLSLRSASCTDPGPREGGKVRTALRVAAVLASTGCLFRPVMVPQSFSIDPPAPQSMGSPGGVVLALARVEVAPPYSGQSLVYRTAEHSLGRDPYARFVAPPAGC